MRAKPGVPEIVLRKGKPIAVILGIERYRKMLERLEDLDDLKALRVLRRKPLKFRPLEEYLGERSSGVPSRH